MVEYLSPDIANEGVKVTGQVPGTSFDADEPYQPMIEPPHIPDYKWINQKNPLAKYFPQISGVPYRHRAFPAILYHPSGETKTVRTAEEAASLGCKCLGPDEGYRWQCDREWKSKPFPAHTKFSAANLGAGKALPPPSKEESIAAAVANALKGGANAVTDQVTMIVAAVVAAMKLQQAAPAPVAPAGAPTPAAVAAPAQENALGGAPDPAPNPDTVLTKDEQKNLLLEAAKDKGVKVDGRWSIERITEELEKIPG